MPVRLRPAVEAPPPDRVVIDEVLAGATDRFALLVQRYNPRLFRVARSVLGHDAESEDALQQAWLQAFTRLSQFRGEAPLASWLTAIVVREARTRALQRRALPEVDAALADRDPDPVERSSSAELRRLLEGLIDALPPAHRTAFVLREVEGSSVAETAAALGVSATLVKIRVFRAKRRLRAQIARHPSWAACLREVYGFDGWRCARLTVRVLARLAV